jgi:hypothetical protein
MVSSSSSSLPSPEVSAVPSNSTTTTSHLNRCHELAAPPRVRSLLVAGASSESSARGAHLSSPGRSRAMPHPRPAAAGATEAASVPRLSEAPRVQGYHPRVMARNGLGGRCGCGGGRAGGREAGDLAANRGETRGAGHHQALPHPGSAFCTAELKLQPQGFA